MLAASQAAQSHSNCDAKVSGVRSDSIASKLLRAGDRLVAVGRQDVRGRPYVDILHALQRLSANKMNPHLPADRPVSLPHGKWRIVPATITLQRIVSSEESASS
jgi:hypothetical protein